MFQFTRFALSSLFNSRSSSRSFLIRVFSDQNLLPVPRNISLVATPFIASEHQGIRRKLLIAWLILKVQIFQVFSIRNFLFVEISGFEPLTSAVQKQRSTNWAIPPDGPSRIWTWVLTLIRGALWPAELIARTLITNEGEESVSSSLSWSLFCIFP